MVDYMDWAAAMDSEIFREYARKEIPKIAEEKVNKKIKIAEELESKIDAQLKAFDDLEAFEKKVKASPELLKQFRVVRDKVLSNPEIMKRADPAFVEGILMLDLEDDDDV